MRHTRPILPLPARTQALTDLSPCLLRPKIDPSAREDPEDALLLAWDGICLETRETGYTRTDRAGRTGRQSSQTTR